MRSQAQLIDELLGSPHFGERGGRRWLDLERHAETRGREVDFPIPNAWQYRDYVVRAFNAGVPYGRFVREPFGWGPQLEATAAREGPQDGFDATSDAA